MAKRTHVALLRGVNLGGHNRMAMSDLRVIATSLGLANVATYIQSGNLVFTSTNEDPMTLAKALELRIAEDCAVQPDVIVLTREELAAIVADNPYPAESNPKCLHVVFNRGGIGADTAVALKAAVQRAQARGSADEGTVRGRHLYLHTPAGLGRSELAAELNRPAALRNAPTVSTMRNWATVTKLLALLDD